MPKIKRKLWITIFGKLKFSEVVELAKNNNIEVLKAFKPDMMCDIHFGMKGEKSDIDNFKKILNENKNTFVNRCPKRSFQFDI